MSKRIDLVYLGDIGMRHRLVHDYGNINYDIIGVLPSMRSRV
jgi:uncharacterized protein with HEPN domain